MRSPAPACLSSPLPRDSTPTRSSTRAGLVSARGNISSLLPAITNTGQRRPVPPWRGSSPSTTGSRRRSCLASTRTATSLPAPPTCPAWRRSRAPMVWSSSPVSSICPTGRCSTSTATSSAVGRSSACAPPRTHSRSRRAQPTPNMISATREMSSRTALVSRSSAILGSATMARTTSRGHASRLFQRSETTSS